VAVLAPAESVFPDIVQDRNVDELTVKRDDEDLSSRSVPGSSMRCDIVAQGTEKRSLRQSLCTRYRPHSLARQLSASLNHLNYFGARLRF